MCPNCGSNRTQTCAMASAQGTSTTVMAGLALDGQNDVGYGLGLGFAQTSFAAANTPRHRPTLPYAAAAAMIVLAALVSGPAINAGLSGQLAGFGWTLAAIVSWVLVPLVVIRQKARMRRWARAMELYAQMWVCSACGTQWV